MRIRELRKQKRLTQEEIARRLGVGRTTYLGYESAKIGIPAKRLEQLADMFDVSIDYISGKTDYRTMYEQWDSEHDTESLKREVIVREFAKEDMKAYLRIALETLEMDDDK